MKSFAVPIGAVCAAILVLAGVLRAEDSLACRFFEAQKPDVKQAAKAAPQMAPVAAAAIEAIAMERGGSGPKYSLLVKADGTARFSGNNGMLTGERVATIGADPFQVLAQLAVDIGFFQLKDAYKSYLADVPVAYTAVKAGGVEKIVLNHHAKGPEELLRFQAALDQLIAQTVWTEPSR